MLGLLDRTSLRVASVLASGIAVGVLLVPRIADACSCIGEANIIVPVVDEEHPASAALLVDAFCFAGEFGIFSATVDDVPVGLGFEWLQGDGLNAVTIDPPPQPGQVVVVSRCGTADGSGCVPETPLEQVLQYTAGPADVVAPASVGEVTLQHEIGDFEVGCLDYAPLQFHVNVTGLDPADEPDLLYTIELREPPGVTVETTVIHVHEPMPALDASFHLYTVPDDVEEYCAAVVARDLSGNATLVAEVCGSESLNPDEGTGTDGGPDTGDMPPGDGSDGGDDDDSSDPSADDASTDDPDGTSSDDADADSDLGDRGCSCRASTPTPASAWLLVFVLASLRRRSITI